MNEELYIKRNGEFILIEHVSDYAARKKISKNTLRRLRYEKQPQDESIKLRQGYYFLKKGDN